MEQIQLFLFLHIFETQYYQIVDFECYMFYHNDQSRNQMVFCVTMILKVICMVGLKILSYKC